MPPSIIEDLLDDSIQNLNRLPPKNGISKHLSPLTIVTGESKIDFTKLRLSFGECAEAHEDNGYQANSINTSHHFKHSS